MVQLKCNTHNWKQLSGISPHLANNLTSIHVCVEVSENHTLSIWRGFGLSPFSNWLSKIGEMCFLTTALRLSPLKNIALMICLCVFWCSYLQVFKNWPHHEMNWNKSCSVYFLGLEHWGGEIDKRWSNLVPFIHQISFNLFFSFLNLFHKFSSVNWLNYLN